LYFTLNKIFVLSENVTRFYVLAASPNHPLPLALPGPQRKRALLRISYRDINPACPSFLSKVTITELIAAIGLPIIRFDRRPSLSVEIFQDVYFVELQERQGDEVTMGVDSVDSWSAEVESAVDRVKRLDVDAVVLGTWGGVL
jgi:prephenate dehydratase